MPRLEWRHLGGHRSFAIISLHQRRHHPAHSSQVRRRHVNLSYLLFASRTHLSLCRPEALRLCGEQRRTGARQHLPHRCAGPGLRPAGHHLGGFHVRHRLYRYGSQQALSCQFRPPKCLCDRAASRWTHLIQFQRWRAVPLSSTVQCKAAIPHATHPKGAHCLSCRGPGSSRRYLDSLHGCWHLPIQSRHRRIHQLSARGLEQRHHLHGGRPIRRCALAGHHEGTLMLRSEVGACADLL